MTLVQHCFLRDNPHHLNNNYSQNSANKILKKFWNMPNISEHLGDFWPNFTSMIQDRKSALNHRCFATPHATTGRVSNQNGDQTYGDKTLKKKNSHFTQHFKNLNCKKKTPFFKSNSKTETTIETDVHRRQVPTRPRPQLIQLPNHWTIKAVNCAVELDPAD